MDLFCEYIVKKRINALDVLRLVGIILLAGILSFVLLIAGTYLLGFGIGLVFAVAVLYLAFVLAKGIYTEYEYALTNNEMDVDRIVGKSRRKRLITVDFKTVEICANANDEKYKYEYENTASISKIIDVTGKSVYDIYFVDFVGEKGKTRVLFQPTEKMKDGLKLVNPRAVHIV